MMIQRPRRFLPIVLARRSIPSLLLLALMVMGLPALSGAQQACLPDGDVDRNGSVTAADALLAFQQALSLVQLDTCQLTIADVFPQPSAPDGSITASDALCIFQRALSLPSCLPDAPANLPPVVNVGPDLFVDEGDTVYLSGLADDPDGDIASYLWEQTSGPDVVLSGAETATASFTAPEVPTDETLMFQLTVTDNEGARTPSDELTVTVWQVESAVLKVSVFGEGDLNVVGSSDQLDCDAITMCEGIFDRGREIVIEASPAADWILDGWGDCDQVSGNQCTVSLTGDRLVSVTFLSEEPVELQDGVIVLDDDQLTRIVSYDADTGLLVVTPGMLGVNDWMVGDILLSDGVDTDPEQLLAFALRITHIESTPGDIRIETDRVSLAELFRSGSFSSREQVQDATLPSIVASDSTIVLDQRLPKTPRTTFDLGGGASVSTELDFNFDHQIAFNADPLEMRVVLNAQATGSFEVDLGPLSSGVLVNESFKLKEFNRPVWIPIVIPTPVGPIPWRIPVMINVPVHLTVQVEVGLTVEPAATYTVTTTAGMHYRDGPDGESLESIFNVDTQPTLTFGGIDDVLTGERPLEDVKLKVEAGLMTSAEALFFNSAGPVIAFHPYFGGETCDWSFLNLYTGANLEVGGKLEVSLDDWLGGSDDSDYDVSEELYLPPLTVGPTNIGTIRLWPAGTPPALPVRDLEVFYVGVDRLYLRWLEPGNRCGVLGYNVYRDGRKIGNVATLEQVKEDVAGQDTEPIRYFDEGLKPDTEYCYQVAAVLPTGEEARRSIEVCDATLEPVPPTDVQLPDPKSRSMTVAWTPPWNSPWVSGYVIYRHAVVDYGFGFYSDADPDDFRVVGRTTAEDEEFTVTGLDPETQYCFSVASVYDNRFTSEKSYAACDHTVRATPYVWIVPDQERIVEGQSAIFRVRFDPPPESELVLITTEWWSRPYREPTTKTTTVQPGTTTVTVAIVPTNMDTLDEQAAWYKVLVARSDQYDFFSRRQGDVYVDDDDTVDTVLLPMIEEVSWIEEGGQPQTIHLDTPTCDATWGTEEPEEYTLHVFPRGRLVLGRDHAYNFDAELSLYDDRGLNGRVGYIRHSTYPTITKHSRDAIHLGQEDLESITYYSVRDPDWRGLYCNTPTGESPVQWSVP